MNEYADINNNGLITVKKDGKIKVKVTALDGSGVFAIKEIQVKKTSVTIPVTSITVPSQTITDEGVVNYTISPSNATNKNVKFSFKLSTSNATIDSSTGKITVTNDGSVVVVVTALDGSGVKGEGTITLKKSIQLIPIESCDFSPIQFTNKGNLVPIFNPSNASIDYYKFTSNAVNYLTIDSANNSVEVHNTGSCSIKLKVYDKLGNSVVCIKNVECFKSYNTSNISYIAKVKHGVGDGSNWDNAIGCNDINESNFKQIFTFTDYDSSKNYIIYIEKDAEIILNDKININRENYSNENIYFKTIIGGVEFGKTTNSGYSTISFYNGIFLKPNLNFATNFNNIIFKDCGKLLEKWNGENWGILIYGWYTYENCKFFDTKNSINLYYSNLNNCVLSGNDYFDGYSMKNISNSQFNNNGNKNEHFYAINLADGTQLLNNCVFSNNKAEILSSYNELNNIINNKTYYYNNKLVPVGESQSINIL